MKIILFYVVCGVIVILHETYGSNATLLESKMTGGECISDDVKQKINVGSIRMKDGTKIIQTVYIINQRFAIATARFLEELYSLTVNEDGTSDHKKAGKVFEIIDSSSYKQNLNIVKGFLPGAHNKNRLFTAEFADLDIGILEARLRGEKFVTPAPFDFAKPYDKKIYTEADVYSWVVTSNVSRGDETFQIKQELRKLEVKVFTREECAVKYNLEDGGFPLNLLCVESPSMEKRLEQMDLGSPVINGRTLIGIISHVSQNDTDFKAVMMNMKIFSPWIENVTSNLPNTA